MAKKGSIHTQNKSNVETIRVLSSDLESITDINKAFPVLDPTAYGCKITEVATKCLCENLGKTIQQLQLALDGIDDKNSSYRVDEAHFALSVDTKGEVSLIGKVGGGMKESITVTLKRKP